MRGILRNEELVGILENHRVVVFGSWLCFIQHRMMYYDVGRLFLMGCVGFFCVFSLRSLGERRCHLLVA